MSVRLIEPENKEGPLLTHSFFINTLAALRHMLDDPACCYRAGASPKSYQTRGEDAPLMTRLSDICVTSRREKFE